VMGPRDISKKRARLLYVRDRRELLRRRLRLPISHADFNAACREMQKLAKQIAKLTK